MELDITSFFNAIAPMDFSASVAEIGANAGPDTWRAACEESADSMLLDNEEKREAFRDWLKPYGAWDEAEIAAFSNVELNALLIQWISGDMRECSIGPDSTADDWADYEARAEQGQCPSNIFRTEDGTVYFTLSH